MKIDPRFKPFLMAYRYRRDVDRTLYTRIIWRETLEEAEELAYSIQDISVLSVNYHIPSN